MNDPTTPDPGVRRPLTVVELDRIHTAITTADTTATLATAVIETVFDALLSDSGRQLADFGPDRLLDPGRYAIPASQWQAITTAATNRATAWGTAASVGLDLVNRLPDPYDDPATPGPGWAHHEHRPAELDLRLDRDATDVITATQTHLAALAGQYGPASARYLDALRSWNAAVGLLLRLDLGSPVQVHRDGPLSLLVTAPGLTYAVVFHGQPRHCTLPGCGILLPEQPNPTAPHDNRHDNGGCEHRPSYPYGGAQPGTWTIHS